MQMRMKKTGKKIVIHLFSNKIQFKNPYRSSGLLCILYPPLFSDYRLDDIFFFLTTSHF
jgi:hypothetical protein